MTPQEKEILHFVDLRTGKRVASHLSIGQGPGEVLYPGLVNMSEKVRVADLMSFTTNRQDRIAVCYNWTSLIDILDEKGHLCRRLQGPLNFTSLFKESRNGRVVSARSVRGNRWDAYVISADCGDEFWVTYSGKSEEDADYGNGIRDILSFGWDGALHTHYQLDKSISSFAVDKAGRKIYAICDQPDVHLEEFVNH